MLTALLALLATAGTGCPEGTTLDQVEREIRCLDAEGQPHGPFVRVYPDGTTAARGEYAHGVMTGVWERFHPNGQLASRVEYVDGLPQGDYAYFHEDGTPGPTVRYDHGERVSDVDSDVAIEAQKVPDDIPRGIDLSGTARMFPLQVNASVSHLFTISYRNYVKAAVHYAHGSLTYNRNGTGRGLFWGVGAEAETTLFSWTTCASRCMNWALGPSFRFGSALSVLSNEARAVPGVVLSDAFAYVQFTPRYIAVEGLNLPLTPFSRYHIGGKLELGVTAAGWTFRLFNAAHAVTLVVRAMSLLLGLAMPSPLLIGASLSNHASLWGELQVPEKANRLTGAIGVSFGVGI